MVKFGTGMDHLSKIQQQTHQTKDMTQKSTVTPFGKMGSADIKTRKDSEGKHSSASFAPTPMFRKGGNHAKPGHRGQFKSSK